MSPEELAHIDPNLFHVTEPDAWPKIQKHGLLPTLAILDLFEVDHSTRVAVTEQCRPTQIPLNTDDIEICPINSGSTIRKPARRGLKTFTPLGALPYKD